MAENKRNLFLKFKQKRTPKETEDLIVEIVLGIHEYFSEMLKKNIHNPDVGMRKGLHEVIEKDGNNVRLHDLVRAAIKSHCTAMEIMCDSKMLENLCRDYEKADDEEHGR